MDRLCLCPCHYLKPAIIPRCKPNENIYSSTKQDKPRKAKRLSEKIVCPFTQIEVYQYAPKPIETVKNNQGKETDMKGNPSGRRKSLANFIVIAGGIPRRTKVECKKMNGHSHNQQQGCNPLQKPRPKTSFFYIHFLYKFIKSSLVKIDSKEMFFLSIFSRPPSWRSTRAMAFITFRFDSLALSMASIVD